MRLILVLSLAAMAAFAADPWAKVQELKSGGEVRIFKTHSTKPVLGKIEEVHDDSVIIATRNEEIAVQKDDIDRLDYRPAGGTKGTKTTRTTTSDPVANAAGPAPTHSREANGSGASSSTDYSFGSKPDFQTVYRRPAGK
jgi:hypothetical protein